MKQLIITLGILCLCLNSKLTASNYFTQSNTPNTTIEHQLDAVDQLLFNSYTEQELKLTPQQIQKLSTQQRITILGRFFRWIGEFFEPVWGKYREPHRRTQGPYMVFQYSDITDLQAKIAIIRDNIITKKYGYDELYYEIFIKARDGVTANCNDKNKVCDNANTAKCAAFVYVLGLNLIEVSPPNVTYDSLEYFTPFSNPITRDSYRTKAEDILLNVDVPDLNNYMDRLAGVPFLSLFTNFINGVGFLDLIHRSRELLSYLAAFDMLRWCHNIDPSLPESSGTSSTDNMAKRLKRQIATPMYNRAIGLMFPVNHNNHSLMVGAALGSAAIVIGEWGGKSLFDWHNWPNRWANVSNYQIHNVMWRDPLIYWPFLQFPPGKLSATGGTHGFAEGDHYFKITMENMLPYMVAQYNYQQGVYTRGYRNYPIGLLNIFPSPHALYMKTMMKDPDYDNLFKWYRNITMPNGKSACIDESWNNVNSSGILGIKKITTDGEFLQTFDSESAEELGIKLGIDLTADYLAAIPIIDKWSNYKSVQMDDGTTVLRNTQNLPGNKKANHLLLVLAEDDVANNSAWHEQSDVGHITLAVDGDNLLIDPAKWNGIHDITFPNISSNSSLLAATNKLISLAESIVSQTRLSLSIVLPGLFSNHNIIYHGRYVNSVNHYTTPIKPINQSFKIVMNEDDYSDTRIIELVKGANYLYYIVNDRCTNVEHEFSEIKFNGNSELGYTQTNGKAQWNYPCNINSGDGRWGLIIESAVTSTTAVYSSVQEKHGSFNNDFLQIDDYSNGWGYHKAFKVTSPNKKNVHFISKLLPYRCNINNHISNDIDNSDDYAMLRVRIGNSNNSDSIRNYHFATSPEKDSISVNPITIKGHSGFISWDDDTIFKNGYCLSFTGFRKATANSCKRLMYNNIDVIKADKYIDAHYQLVGKYKYHGYVSVDTATDVTFYMGDVDYGYAMIAKDKMGNAILSSHDEKDPIKHKYITLRVGKGLTEFTLELADPCLVSCFFPPTVITIDTFFDFYQGTTETLGHNLDIVKDSGELHIRDGSKVSICPNYYLFNRDSITMKSDEANPQEKFPFYAAEVDLPGGGTGITDSAYLSRYGSKRSMIIVNDLSALILDSGSYTHVGAGATIIIKKGGTLYVKKGATLEIGSQSLNGYGELIAEVGSYICIEDSSDLHFFVTSPDTNNSNLVFVPMGVNESVNQSAIQSGFSTDGRFAGAVNCLPLCSLWYYLEDYGVNNPDFGSNSLGRPLAKFTLPADTLCGDVDSIIYINASASLNEVKYRITVTRLGVQDSVYFRSQNGAYGMLTNREPINLIPLGLGAGTIKFELVVENTCGDTDYVSKTMYIPVAPTVNFELASDTICPGYGTLLADGSSSTSGMSNIKHEWTVFLIDTNSYAIGDTNQIAYGQVWQIDSSAVGSQFNFPNFRWVGGFNYLVGLKVYGNCDMVAEKWDTVSVPFQVFINSNGLNTSNTNIGNQINLQGFITTAYDSFVWYPSTLVSDPDTLMPYTTSTQDSTLYTLTAYSGACVAVDSIWVKHKEFVNLGVDTTVCVGTEMILGNKLDPSLLVGLLAYIDYTTYSIIMKKIDTKVSSPANALGRYLYDNDYLNFNKLKNPTTAFTDLLTVYGYTFYSHPSYLVALTYYKSHSLSKSLDYFKNDFWPNHPELVSVIDNQIANYGGLSSFLSLVNGELINMLTNFHSTSTITTTTNWYKDNVHLPVEDKWFMISDQINETTKYTLVVSSPGSVEYDDIMVYVDSALTPYYSLGTMIDSVTVQFLNYTNANSFNNTTTYKWYFGDGDSSTVVNPIHHYQVKDSSYVVCLQATNRCGTYSFCDTLPLGSIQVNGFAKKGATKEPLNWQQPKPIDKQELGKLSYKNYLGYNRPNPFKGTTQFDYELKPNTKDAFIKINNQLGQELRQIKLYSVKGTVELTEEGWQSGLYYYSLVVDGVVVDSKIMQVK